MNERLAKSPYFSQSQCSFAQTNHSDMFPNGNTFFFLWKLHMNRVLRDNIVYSKSGVVP